MITGAIILAGGRSTRYGRDKATLPYGGGTLLEHVVREARQVTHDIVVVGGAAEPEATRLVTDLAPGGGPLQAALAGARALPDGERLLLACDLPFVSAALLARIAAPLEHADARVPRVGGREQYLAGLYGPAAWQQFETRWAAGCRSLHGACRGLPIAWLEEHDLERAGIPLATLRDVDTPEDWDAGADSPRQPR